MAVTYWLGGSFAGKAGGYVGSNWKGIKTVRSVPDPKKTRPEPSDAQQGIRTKFRMITDVAKSINDIWLKKYFKNVKKMSPYNYFVKASKEAMQGEEADPLNIQFPQSYLGAPIAFAETPTISGATVSLSVPAPSELSLGTPTEYVISVYEPEINVAVAKVVPASASSVSITLPKEPTAGTSVYAYLQAGDGSKVNFSSVTSITA